MLHNVSIRLGLEIGLFNQLTKITLLKLIGRVDLRILLWIRSSDSIIHDHWDHFAKTLLMISLITYYHPFAFPVTGKMKNRIVTFKTLHCDLPRTIEW